MAENKPALVLAQGLQALGDYIADERAAAHPEAFILLHSFNDALEQVLRPDGQRLEQEKIQDLLVDRINRLNNLKLLIAAPPGGLVDDQRIDEMVEELSTPVVSELGMEEFSQPEAESISPPSMLTEDFSDDLEISGHVDKQSTVILEAEIDNLFAMGSMPAMESADVQYPDEILSPDAIQPVEDELADDFIEAHLSTNRGLTPALSDTDETSGFNESAELLDQSTQSDLADQLDFLFSEAEASNDSTLTFSALDSSDLEIAIDGGEESVAALADVNQEIEQDTVEAALSDAEEPEEHSDLHSENIQETETDPNALEIQSKLDNFFIDIDEEPAETINAPQTTVEEIEQSLFFNEEDNVQSALADSEEEQGFSEEAEVATLSFTPMDEIEEKLDFFFGTDADEEPEPDTYQYETSPSDLLEESLDLTFSEPESEQIIPPALDEFVSEEASDYQEQSAFDGQIHPDEPLEEALDLFFTDIEEEQHETLPTAVDELTSALEATIDDIQDKPLTESRQIQLAALGALLPIVVRAPSHEKFTEAATLVANLKKTGLTTEQQSLDSVITMLVRLPTKDDAATEKLVNYLYEQLLAEHCLPGTLPEAIGRYTAWLQQASAIMPVVPATTDEESEPKYAYTAKELYFELSELRAHIREEFAKLRLEMHHHKS
jgi:pilus assembly protein FimV